MTVKILLSLVQDEIELQSEILIGLNLQHPETVKNTIKYTQGIIEGLRLAKTIIKLK